MSIKVRVSYTEDEELAGVIRLLSPLVKSWKISKNHPGKYKKAYGEEGARADHTKQREKSGGTAGHGEEGRNCFWSVQETEKGIEKGVADASGSRNEARKK